MDQIKKKKKKIYTEPDYKKSYGPPNKLFRFQTL